MQCKEEAPAMHLCNMTPKKQSMLKIYVLCIQGIASKGIRNAAAAQSLSKKERPPRKSATGVEKAFAEGRSLAGD